LRKQSEISPEEIHKSLNAIVSSDILGGSVRLREFLTYVVEMGLDNPGEKIPAKLISQDVYKRQLDIIADNDNIVRVDAGRLRRRLDQYYLDAGKSDSVRIYMDAGGYAPRFEYQSEPISSVQSLWVSKPSARVFALIIGLMTIFGFAYFVATSVGTKQKPDGNVQPTNTVDNRKQKRILERQAIHESSIHLLLSVNLAEQARGLIFPIFDADRLKQTGELFRRSIELDSQYFGGYAGAAQVSASLAFIAPTGLQKIRFQTEAQQFLDWAMRLNPTNSWVQSAAAWVAFSAKNYSQAIPLSNRALELDPEDGNILDFHGVITLFDGDFAAARKATNPDRVRNNVVQRFASRNIYGAASFHMGDYNTTIRSFLNAVELGDPVSPLTLVYLAAAYHASGDKFTARKMVTKLKAAWPNFKADILIGGIYRHAEHSNDVISRLRAAGWISPEQK
jgi:tetratricopeptide (TPR) repeat protein